MSEASDGRRNDYNLFSQRLSFFIFCLKKLCFIIIIRITPFIINYKHNLGTRSEGPEQLCATIEARSVSIRFLTHAGLEPKHRDKKLI